MRSYFGVAFVLSMLLICGCGGYSPDSGVTIRGKIVKGGEPLKILNPEAAVGSVNVMLVPQGEGEFESTICDADGSFIFQGAGRGIKPGKYRLAVMHDFDSSGTDKLKGKFGETNTILPLVDASADKVGGSIDLGTIDLDTVK